MQLPVETTNVISLGPLYELLNINEPATEQAIRDTYIHLCRIWHPKALQHWLNWGVQPNQDYIEQIYNRIKSAYEILSTPESYEKYKKGELVIKPLEEVLFAYKEECESQLSEKANKPTEIIKPEEVFNLPALPTDLILLLASFFPATSLARFAMTSRRMSQATKELCWLSVAQSGSRDKLSKFLTSNPDFSSKNLNVIFSKTESVPENIASLFSTALFRHKLDKLTKLRKQPPFELTYQRLGPTVEFFNYLKANARDLFVMSNLISEIYCNEDINTRAFLRAIVGEMSVFEFITLLPFDKVLSQFLARSICSGAQLPAPFKTRENFESITAYFQYLIKNIHDLYIALHADPTLINTRDENGQTLLFYPAINAPNSSEDELQWAVSILLQVPNITLETVDNNGNTFLHQTARECVKYKVIKRIPEFTLFNYAFKPFIKFAVEHNFSFQLANHESLTVIHLAAEVQLGESGDGPFRELLNYVNSPELRSKILSHALRKGKLMNAQLLFALPDNQALPVQQDLAFLQEAIYTECSQLKKFDCLLASNLGTMEYWAASRDFHGSFIGVKKIQRTFLKIAGLPMPDFEEGMTKVTWLNQEMIRKLIYKIEQSSSVLDNYFLLSEEAKKKGGEVITVLREKITIDKKESTLFGYLCSFDNTSTANAIKTVFEEELNVIIKNVYRHSNLVTDIPNPPSLPNLRALLATKLLELEKSPSINRTQELGAYFNKLTKGFSIADCEELFNFLLIYRDPDSAAIFSLTPVDKNALNWPALVEIIRKGTLEALIAFNEPMEHDEAIKYLTDCRKLLIFNLPNSFAEKFGRTSAVVVIDSLIRQREYECTKNASGRLAT